MNTLFQSTQPSQAVTLDDAFSAFALGISIHTALAGCDPGYLQHIADGAISIHTALAGCDGYEL